MSLVMPRNSLTLHLCPVERGWEEGRLVGETECLCQREVEAPEATAAADASLEGLESPAATGMPAEAGRLVMLWR